MSKAKVKKELVTEEVELTISCVVPRLILEIDKVISIEAIA